ncbi:MAG TPA: hypothetical protein VN605_13925 [Thermoanaerobaculia bacterium]|nr:hypothetical protein [Thermoanaerobaculia bacterium]
MRNFRNVLALSALFTLVISASPSKGFHEPQTSPARSDHSPANHHEDVFLQSALTSAPRHGVDHGGDHAASALNPLHDPSEVVRCAETEGRHFHNQHSPAASHSNAEVDHNHLAIADMQDYAAHHIRDAEERCDTFGVVSTWAPDWELRWIDYQTFGDLIRVYHAMNKHDHQLRYTSLRDRHHYYEWQPVR